MLHISATDNGVRHITWCGWPSPRVVTQCCGTGNTIAITRLWCHHRRHHMGWWAACQGLAGDGVRVAATRAAAPAIAHVRATTCVSGEVHVRVRTIVSEHTRHTCVRPRDRVRACVMCVSTHVISIAHNCALAQPCAHVCV